jgi:hypothetical protein
MTYFASDHSTMAVVPSIVVHTPKTLIQKIQKVLHLAAFDEVVEQLPK